MSGTSHTIAITDIGVDDPTVVQAQDTVVWQCETTSDDTFTSAAITFTGSEPFTKSLSGTVTLSSDGRSSTYTVSNTAQNGKYPYNVVVKTANASRTYSCNIQVVSGETVKVGGTSLEI